MPLAEREPPDVERFRGYLTVLARAQIGARCRALLAPSDVVNATLFEAHRKRDQFRGSTDEEFAAWLRRALANNLADEVRKLEAGKRDVRRQVSLEAAVEESGLRLGAIADGGPSPSDRVIRGEELLRLADAIAGLPEPQRSVVEWYHLGRLPLAEVAAQLGRTEAAVGGLLHRALRRLRREVRE